MGAGGGAIGDDDECGSDSQRKEMNRVKSNKEGLRRARGAKPPLEQR